jgi:glutaredoxin-like protein
MEKGGSMGQILPADIKKELQSKFKNSLKDPVSIIYFTMELECEFCRQTHDLLDEVTALSDLLSLSVFKFDIDKKVVEKYHIDKIPAIVIESEKNHGIRFFGLPAGYEFSALIGSIIMVSTKETGLKKESIEKISKIKKPIHIQVFSTNTCPYCPTAVHFAHKLAYLNKNITSDGINATEFIPLTQKYNVVGVPKIVINEKVSFEGALPEEPFIAQVLSAEKIK